MSLACCQAVAGTREIVEIKLDLHHKVAQVGYITSKKRTKTFGLLLFLIF